ncbi:MAG: anthranilate synthase component I family protein [Acidobacteriota bacterium]|nr:anthranilate synthase component I family protein [Acidobacteriota bacterium]
MPESFNFNAEVFNASSDSTTPVALYSNLRQIFPETLLLECVEPHSPETASSFVCADAIARFSVKNGKAEIEREGRKISEIDLKADSAIAAFDRFRNSIKIQTGENDSSSGLFGYVGFSAIPHFEDIRFSKLPQSDEQIPDMQFALYRYVFRFDHFRNALTATKLHNAENPSEKTTPLSDLFATITRRRAVEFPFAAEGGEAAEISDADFAEIVRVCQRHINRGDVYQIVPSRKFSVAFRGDEFAVYRALRRINPSPFLFFFDYGGFSLFGSSPEAQLLIKNRTATLHPIAGTYPRGKNAQEDLEFAQNLINDSKETAEHVMLVDLARNDLGRSCSSVRVEKFKTVEFYSHVIHLVSQVSGKLNDDVSAAQVFADTFPAGTLSGAPKYRAMQILNELEPSARSFYGGSVGFFGLDGSCTQAIMIRSFLARRRKLIFQAGAGVVADSVPEKETAEVRNKLAALRRAIESAEKLNQRAAENIKQ